MKYDNITSEIAKLSQSRMTVQEQDVLCHLIVEITEQQLAWLNAESPEERNHYKCMISSLKSDFADVITSKLTDEENSLLTIVS